MEVVRFRLRRPDEVESVVSMLASMHDAPDRIIQGIYELVQNAVEHGVLRFGLEAKGRLLEEGRWEAALAERVADPAYGEGCAEATAIRREDGIYINIKDNGFLNYPGQDGWGYCVFGEVVEGMDVVEKIKNVEFVK